MVDCPACISSSLEEFTVRERVTVEVCRGCKGMLVDERAFEQLAGACDLGAIGGAGVALAGLGPCLRCNTSNWQWHAVGAEGGAGLGLCGTCGMVWFQAGELDRLQRHLLAEKRRARALEAANDAAPEVAVPEVAVPEVAVPEVAATEAAELGAAEREVAEREAPLAPPPEPFGRISFDAGMGNRLGAPLALVLGFGFAATPAGRFFGSLVSMPFHELGHALASWLGSRFAVPLPFFTVWSYEQSLPFGLAVAAALGGFAFYSWRERRRFGLVVALGLLSLQLVGSCFLPARLSEMCQILAGALGELVLGALVLVAFHFPLPDRLRWDFWRWPALLPGAVCFGHATLTWLRAASDPRHIPWGAAIGNESDGDMNRLVRDFGWSAAELGGFYSKAACLSALAIGAAYALAYWRQRRAQGMARMVRQ